MPAASNPSHPYPSFAANCRPLSDDYLGGVEAIAAFMGWTIRKVRYARETGALPIRVKHGVGLYAFKSELVRSLQTPETLQSRKS